MVETRIGLRWLLYKIYCTGATVRVCVLYFRYFVARSYNGKCRCGFGVDTLLLCKCLVAYVSVDSYLRNKLILCIDMHT